jgi:hypothetical protein
MILQCKKCGEEKEINLFYFDKQKGKPRTSCKKCHNETVKIWQNNNREKVRGYIRMSCKKAYDKNPEKFKEKSKLKRQENPEKTRKIVNKSYKKIYAKRYNQERARLNNLSASRRRATPRWISAIEKAMIQEIYDVAKSMTMQTGIKHHVDHIMPINGVNSCGLHLPWNLQILTAFENCSKKNKILEAA